MGWFVFGFFVFIDHHALGNLSNYTSFIHPVHKHAMSDLQVQYHIKYFLSVHLGSNTENMYVHTKLDCCVIQACLYV